MSYMPLKQQSIWLVGASSGIGEALVAELQPRCRQLYISARSEDKLQTMASLYNNVKALPLDVTDTDAAQSVANQISENGGIDMLIANAGTCEYVDVQQLDVALFERVMRTNFIGLVNCTAAALPLLRKSPKGCLAAMSSSSSWLAMPRAQAYGASKAATNYFMESMRADLVHEGIDTCVIFPGFVDTPLTKRNDFDMPMMISASEAARHIAHGLEQRQLSIHFPKRFTWPLKVLGLLPALVRLKIAARLSRQQGAVE